MKEILNINPKIERK